MMQRTQNNRLAESVGEFENLFNQFFGGTGQAAKFAQSKFAPSKFAPSSDVFELDTSFEISVELPGVQQEDISLEFVEGQLQISGEKKLAEFDQQTSTCHRSERRSGPFQRTFKFPVDIDSDNVSAKFENGVLHVILPKAPQVLPRKIQIKTNGQPSPS